MVSEDAYMARAAERELADLDARQRDLDTEEAELVEDTWEAEPLTQWDGTPYPHDESRAQAVMEHIRHAIAQAGITATVTASVVPAVRVSVADPVRRYALAQVITDGTPTTREVYETPAGRIEHLTGRSRLDPGFQVVLTGPTS